MLSLLISLFLLQLLGAMIPGPDFLFVLRTSLHYGHSKGFLVALGIALGAGVYSASVVLLLDFLRDNLLSIMRIITLCGALYLIYMAYGIFKSAYNSKKNSYVEQDNIIQTKKTSSKSFFISGVLCNLSNPKAIIWFLSLLPIFILKSNLWLYHLAIVIIIFLTTLLWFSLMAFIMANPIVQKWFGQYLVKLECVFAVILLTFSSWLLYSFFMM